MLLPYPEEKILLNKLQEHLVAKLLPAKAHEQLKQGNIAQEFLISYAEALKKMSVNYIRQNIKTKLSKLQAEAYALYFLPINFVKVLRSLAMLSINKTKPIRILDFGSGPGTATLALIMSGYNLSEAILVEHEIEMRKIAIDLAPKTVKAVPEIAEQLGQFDLIICANSLNELEQSQSQEILKKLIALINPEGELLIIEPAQKNITRTTMQLRDWIIANSDVKIAYPCTHQKSCPMLNAVNEDQTQADWCHTELTWQPLQLIKQLDQLTGFNKHRLKTSVFIFRRHASTTEQYRIVNFPIKKKYGLEVMLCGNDYYGTKILDKSEAKSVKNYSLLSD